MSAAEQGRVFLAMALAGAGLCIACGAAAALLRALHAGPVLLGLADVLAGVVFAGGIILVALALRIEAVRWYVFAGVMAGAMLAAGGFALCRKLYTILAGRVCQKQK